LPDVRIKSPNSDDVFEKWKTTAVRKNKKKMEKEFGTKGAIFSIDNISAAETVKDIKKEAAIYFAIKKIVEPVKGKDENIVLAPKIVKETFYSFKSGEKVDKEKWKGKEKVPMFESIKAIPCSKCHGTGYVESKCKTCDGKGKITEQCTVLIGAAQKKEKRPFSYPCATCHGTGKLKSQCGECGGYQNKYKYEILPVPFKTVVTGIPVLHSSAQTKYEKEIERDLHQLIEEVEGIRFKNFKDLEEKAEASLGYWNKEIKKTIASASSDYKSYEKDKSVQIVSNIFLFPMIQLFCESKRGSKFEVYSIGSQEKYMIYSNF